MIKAKFDSLGNIGVDIVDQFQLVSVPTDPKGMMMKLLAAAKWDMESFLKSGPHFHARDQTILANLFPYAHLTTDQVVALDDVNFHKSRMLCDALSNFHRVEAMLLSILDHFFNSKFNRVFIPTSNCGCFVREQRRRHRLRDLELYCDYVYACEFSEAIDKGGVVITTKTPWKGRSVSNVLMNCEAGKTVDIAKLINEIFLDFGIIDEEPRLDFPTLPNWISIDEIEKLLDGDEDVPINNAKRRKT